MARKEYTGGAPETNLSGSMTAGAPAAGATFTVADGTGYPTGSVGNFVVVVDRGTPYEEKILCSLRVTNTYTVATSGRGFDGTTAVAHGGSTSAGTVNHVLDAETLTETSAHLYGTAGVHAATAISNTPAGNIAATTVQAAINELDTEKSGTAHTHSYQPLDATLTDLAANVGTAANKVPYSTAADTFSELALDTDTTLAANSDVTLATQKATKTYVDNHTGLATSAVMKMADEAIAATSTLQADNELTIAVAASTTYLLEMMLLVDSDTVTDFKFQLDGPSGATGTFSAANVTTTGNLATSSLGTPTGTIQMGSAIDMVIARGHITTDVTAGNLSLQWAGAAVSGGITVKADSFIKLTKSTL